MGSELIQVRVPAETKAMAEEIFAAMGMKMGEAIRIFLQQTINSHGLPFQPAAKMPNAETIAAIEELKRGGGERMGFDEFYKEFGFEKP